MTFIVSYARRAKAKYCSYRCHQVGEGRKGGVVRAAQMRAASRGKTYVKINGRHAHRVIAEKMLGRPLRSGEVVHHIDGDKLNNSPSNLIVLPNQAAHAREHVGDMLRARKEKHGY